MTRARRDIRGSRSDWVDLFAPLAVLSMILVVGLWILRRGAEKLFGPGVAADSRLTSFGLLAGLVSADLMLLQVVLLARIPWIERAWGHDVLTRRHRWFGFASFWLMCAHVLAFAAERLVRQGSWSIRPWWQLFVISRWMLWASVGTILIIVVTVTSIMIARRRLRYEAWHLIHLYGYLGVGLALPHQIIDGTDFQSSIAQTYWWTVWALTAAAVIIFRIALPLGRSARHRLRVSGVIDEAPGVVSIMITGRGLARLPISSGQFFVWRFRDGRGWTRGHPYTISAAPHDDRLRLTARTDGDGDTRLAGLPPGTRALIEGPYGTMTAARRRRPRMLLCAAGVGITPIRALLEDAPFQPGEATLIYRHSGHGRPIFRDELIELTDRRGVELIMLPGARAADDSWQSANVEGQADAAALAELVPDVADRDIYVCGPLPWIAAVRRAARGCGAINDQIHSEDFAW